MSGVFTDNTAAHRFEYAINGHVAVADYRRDGVSLYIDRVEAPMELRGTGAAGQLMEGIATFAAQEKLTIVPVCPYAVAWLAKREGKTPPPPKSCNIKP